MIIYDLFVFYYTNFNKYFIKIKCFLSFGYQLTNNLIDFWNE
jgi:hypothetical protein